MPPPPAIRALSPALCVGAVSTALVSQISAADRSASGYPTSTRTSGPVPTPALPLSRTNMGPADTPTHGWGADAASTIATIHIVSPPRRKDERIGHEHL